MAGSPFSLDADTVQEVGADAPSMCAKWPVGVMHQNEQLVLERCTCSRSSQSSQYGLHINLQGGSASGPVRKHIAV